MWLITMDTVRPCDLSSGLLVRSCNHLTASISSPNMSTRKSRDCAANERHLTLSRHMDSTEADRTSVCVCVCV